LGYYRRARWMHQAAQKIVADGGEFPSTIEGLRALPGVGEYTAAAVGSIAFGLVEPSLDGNVKRVLGRLLALEVPVERDAGRVRDAARLLLDPTRPGDSNQALMEIGATICTPRQPKCDLCPLESECLAAASGDPTRFPQARSSPAAKVSQRLVIAVACKGERYLLFRRPEESELLAGMWEFPWVEEGEDSARVETALAQGYGGVWSLGRKRGSIRHAITYRSFEIEIREARIDGGSEIAEGTESAWLREEEIHARPHGSMARKVFAALAASDQGGA
jgi:A/G-specific adenine glycosylase